MKKKILIVEDESLIAYNLKLILTKAGYLVCGLADSVKEAEQIIEKESPDLVILDIFLKGTLTGIDLARKLTMKNMAFIFLSANLQEVVLDKAKETQPYGCLVKPFREKDLLITIDVAFYRHHNSVESKLWQERLLEQSFNDVIGEQMPWEQKLLKVFRKIQPYVPFDFLTVILNNAGEALSNGVSFLRTGFDEYQAIGNDDFLNIVNMTGKELKVLQEASALNTESEFFNGSDFDLMLNDYPIKKIISKRLKMQSFLNFPLLMPKGQIISCSFYSRKPDCYTHDHLVLLGRLQRAIVSVISKIVPLENFALPLRGISIEKQPTSEAVNQAKIFDGIIAISHQMLTVLDLVSIVAPLDTSVLILGESGTGKERIAKSIHNLSPRRNKPLVLINCAALPGTLIESELFGFEKGSFTGAVDKRIGKFEQAHLGTIFLDEIGEMPADLQIKLLRVLQEQEIERIGGRETIKIDVRIIAATNRVLEKEVEEGRFRLDLYYRLCVFPITVPPLRDRKEDIPLLTHFFIDRLAKKISKNVTGITPDAMNLLKAYPWPGNVRELEHFIERSLLLADSSIIKEVLLPKFNNLKIVDAPPAVQTNWLKTIDEHAREHIVSVLKSCNGKIHGENGAAEMLGLKPSTLHSKLKKLGISRSERY
jgi:DNA-binding NtrC family response regulator